MITVEICGRDGGPSTCAQSGANALFEAFCEFVDDVGIGHEVRVEKSGCQGACSCGPSVLVFPSGRHYTEVDPSDVAGILENHLDRSLASAV